MPARNATSDALQPPHVDSYARFAFEADGKEMSTTMAFVRMLSSLLRDPTFAPRIVPIIADEGRTFGMADLFRKVGIYAPFGQLYEPEDSSQISFYKEARNGQILEEGINEAGAIASWVAAGTSYSSSGFAMLPFYIFYSMFGFQRVGDLLWAAGDSRTRGFLLGATAGRTTLSGEGLQHQDGTSHLVASTVPDCRAYDPCFAYELALIVDDGMQRMLVQQQDVFYYVTVMNENYAQPSAPWLVAGSPPGCEKAVREGIVRGMYRLQATVPTRSDARSPSRPRSQRTGAPKVRLLGAGAILGEVLAAAHVLAQEFGIVSEVYSVTSFTELRREAMESERSRRLTGSAATSWLETSLPGNGEPVIAASDYVRAVPDLIRPWIRDRYVTLGTDGFGRSDKRDALRAFFEVDRQSIVVAALDALVSGGRIPPSALARAREAVATASAAPWTL
jgi:pyruvate dehydrogenase E1 component